MSSDNIQDEGKDNERKLANNDEVSLDELVDPRVQVELERLNTATDAINKLEIELDETRANFRLLLSESSIRVNQLANKLGACTEKARPYYEARMHAKQLQTQTQKAAVRYERATSAHSAAKEMVYLAEEGLKKEGRCFDPAWQEMLNHATLRVNEAEIERVLSQHEHQKTSLAYNEADKIVQHLHQELRKSILKSSLSTRRSLLQLNNLANQHQLQLLPYFEMKAQFNQLLEEQRKKVHCFEEKILKMKMSYAEALHNLEEISDEIHQKRKSVGRRLSVKRKQIEGVDSLNLPCDTMKLPYHKLKTSDTSSDNISMETLNMEDMYKSLPSKITSGVIGASCIGANSKKPSGYPASLSEFPESSDVKLNKMNKILDQNHGSQSSSCSSPAPDHLEELSTTNSDTHDDYVSLNGEEIPGCTFLSPDLSMLRIHHEDSESLGSTDTLDDNQIECLLLEKVYPLDIQEFNSEKTFINSKSVDNVHF